MTGIELLPADPSSEEDVRNIYLSSFPEEERIPFETLLSMACGDGCDFYRIMVDDVLCGISYVVESPELVFLLYLAVSPDHRGEGIGSDVLWMIKSGCAGRRLFLNIEPVDEYCDNIGQRLRRLRFYERNGFRPQCRYTTPDGMMYMLMSWGGPVSPEEASAFYDSRMP